MGKVGRLGEITRVIVRHGLGHLLHRRRDAKHGRNQNRLGHNAPVPMAPFAEKSVDPALAKRFVAVLEELGTTFIKFGQILSTRGDLLPQGFAEALAALQDNCAPLDFTRIKPVVEQSLGQNIDVCFKSFATTPLASASIAQVHRATTHAGIEVAVKVQRPNIKERMLGDLDWLRILAQVCEAIIEESGLVQPRRVVDEFEQALLNELDFAREATMLERFGQNVLAKQRSYMVPAVYQELSASKVLTMDFVVGRRLSDVRASDPLAPSVANNIVQACFDQVFVDGLFHADPHPGNCLVLKDGSLALIDLGSAGQISFAMRESLVVLVLSIGTRDADAVARLLYRIGIVDERVSLSRLRDACATLLNDKLKDRNTYAEHGAASILQDLFEVAARFKVRIPSEYLLVARAAMTVEGTLRKIDPSFRVVDQAKPMLRRLVEEQFSLKDLQVGALRNVLRARDVVRELPMALSQIMMDLEAGKLRLQIESPQLQQTARNIDALGLMIFLGLVSAALIEGALFILARYEPKVWGLPLIPSLALWGASLLLGGALGRYFVAPKLRKLSLGRMLRRRMR